MKLLLTAAGVRNDSIRQALRDLLGRPFEEADALCVPTASYGHPMVGPGVRPWEFVSGTSELPMVGLGWRSVGLLELTALPSLPRSAWEPVLRGADVLLVGGGDVLYLAHWLRESGVADLLPELLGRTVWVGLSAGSMVLTREVGSDFVQWRPPGDPDDESGLGLVDLSICPHLAPDGQPGNSLAEAEDWAARLSGRHGPAYAIDDETAIVVDGDRVEVVSEGWWRELAAGVAS